MIHAELISTVIINENFHKFSEQLTGINTASIVQAGKKPRGKLAMNLAYYRAFSNPNSDTSDIDSLFGLLHFALLCAGPEIDLYEIMGWPHGLRTLQSPPNRTGVVAAIFSGDGEQWVSALSNAKKEKSNAIIEWYDTCLRQFSKYDLSEFFK